MASSLNPAFYKIPPLRLLCHHCRRRFLPFTAQKRLLTSRNSKHPDTLGAELANDLDNLYKSSSSADFVKSASNLMGLVEPQLGIWPKNSSRDLAAPKESPLEKYKDVAPEPPPHHLHVYSTRHNCHITLSDGKRQPIISVSAGNLGFRKAARGSYEAAYQLGAYVMDRIRQQGLLKEIHAMELILRDFGPGREAFHKILLGNEGRLIRDRVVRVMDDTKIKFGGTRSKKPRRL